MATNRSLATAYINVISIAPQLPHCHRHPIAHTALWQQKFLRCKQSFEAPKRTHHSNSSTLKQHFAAASCSSTSTPAPRRTPCSGNLQRSRRRAPKRSTLLRAMKLGCWCRCRGWLRDVSGNVGVGPWWRFRLCRSKKGERVVATKKNLISLSGVYAGVIFVFVHMNLSFPSITSKLWCAVFFSLLSCTAAVAKDSFPCFSPNSKAIGVLTSNIGWVGYVQFEAGMLVPLQDAASGCCFRVLLLERRVRFGAGLLLPLPGAAAGCCR